MLVDSEGNRLNAIDEVFADPQAVSGSAQVVNGLSCIACHRLGIIGVEDEVRHGANLGDEQRLKIDRLYPPQLQLNLQLAEDKLRFQEGLKLAIEPLIKSTDQNSPRITDLPEPIEFVTRRFRSDLRIADIACELGIEDADQLLKQIQASLELRQLGLEPLAAGLPVKRQTWETTSGESSPFQQVASKLRLGEPARGR